MYLYKKYNNTEAFYQASSQLNPITIADMVTNISAPSSYINLVFPEELNGTMQNQPVVKFNDAGFTTLINNTIIISKDIADPNITYEGDSKLYSSGVTRGAESSFVFTFDKLSNGTYHFIVSCTCQNLFKYNPPGIINPDSIVPINLYIENNANPSLILACSRSNVPGVGNYGTCSTTLIKEISSINPIRIRITTTPLTVYDVRLMNLSISIVKII
jgi:hypothetical protein